jgi:hypothetical protein
MCAFLSDNNQEAKELSTAQQLFWEKYPDTKNIVFVRHLESKYNEYKQAIKKNTTYKKFMTMENNDPEKNHF